MTRNYWLAFLFAICAYMIRTSGIVLVLAILIYLVLEKKYKPAVILTLMFTPFFLIFGTGGVYAKSIMMINPYDITAGPIGLGGLIERMTVNFQLYLKILGETIVPLSSWHGLSAIVGVVLIYVIIRGAR